MYNIHVYVIFDSFVGILTATAKIIKRVNTVCIIPINCS